LNKRLHGRHDSRGRRNADGASVDTQLRRRDVELL
jgi:hypothetical protein